jgi:hypothetical protein
MFWAVAGLFAALAAGFGWSLHQVGSWPQASAVVVSSQVVPAGGAFEAQLVVTVNNQERHLIGGTSQAAENLQARLDSWKAGSQIVVAENPSDPADLRLPPEAADWILPLALVLGAVAMAGMPVAVMAFSRRADWTVWTGRIFILLGAAGLAGSPVLAYERVQVLRGWPEVQARVLNVWEIPGNRGVAAEFEYRVSDADFRSVVSSRGPSNEHFEIGSTRTLRYNPGNPRQATFEAAWEFGYFWEAAVLGLVGLSTAMLGLLVARRL